MERLTKKDGANRNIIEVERYSDEDWIIVENTKYRTISFHSKAIDKLAEFEDLCEKYNVEDLGHLDIMLFVLSGETKHRLKEIQQENQALKDRWEKLKRYMLIEHDWGLENNYQDCSYGIRLVLDKMQELEDEV